MRTIGFQPGSSAPPPSREKIESFQSYYEVRLPESYVRMLNTGNGGVPIENCFDQNGLERLIERFLSIMDEPKAHPIQHEYGVGVVSAQLADRLVFDENLVCAEVLPIAALFAGDHLCFDFREQGEPRVVVWDHEQSRSLQPHLETVAPSFDAFLEMLHEHE